MSALAHSEGTGEVMGPSKLAIDTVLQKDINMSGEARTRGMYRFKFFRMGEFEDVTIDDYMPDNRASPHNNEWWVPLCEKAYAKFNGTYDDIGNGGIASWAFTELTGGISLRVNLDPSQDVESLYDFLSGIKSKALMCTGNQSNNGQDMGLVQGHAYSLLRIEQLNVDQKFPVRLVKIRNPHGIVGKEWTGLWHDDDEQWESVTNDDKHRIGYKFDEKDGEFWMTFNDWMQNFETLDICLLPNT